MIDSGPNEGLVVIETHPVQYHAPVYRCVQERFGIPVTAIYGSDFSVAGAIDPEFGSKVAWDSDLLSGYTSIFLSRVQAGGAERPEDVSVTGIAGMLRKTRPKAVLLPGYIGRMYRRAFFCAWRSQIPIFFRGETTDHAIPRTSAKKWIRDLSLRCLYNRCSALLYIGARSRQHFRRLESGWEDKMFYSPYCVDLRVLQWEEGAREQLRRSQRRRLQIADYQVVLLFSGKLSPRKGPDLILEAVAQVPAALRTRVAVVFLGSGEMAYRLRLMAERYCIETRFAGFHNQTELSPYYHAADLLVLPSRHSETWGLVVNEALHHGLPSVVSDTVGCRPDLIREGMTGECAPSNSVLGLARAIERACGLIARADVRQLCRQQVSSYSVENAAAGIARAFWSVANRTDRSFPKCSKYFM